MRLAFNWFRLATVTVITLTAMLALPAQAWPVWTWSITGDALEASGMFSTAGVADSEGYYLITAIAGQRNGVAIVGLQPTGTAIPGNAGFPVDNLISGSGEQLTGNGFGFETADHAHSNPFFASFLTPVGYAEFHTFDTAGSKFVKLPVTSRQEWRHRSRSRRHWHWLETDFLLWAGFSVAVGPDGKRVGLSR